MIIACLGWGSLVWDPRALPIRGKWFEDGPFLPIEFARQSSDGRITLVIVKDKPLVKSLWTMFTSEGVKGATASLAEREGTLERNIGYWHRDGNSGGEFNDIVSKWAINKGLDAVVWTNLPPKFGNENGKVPTAEEVVHYLAGLPVEKQRHCKDYILKAPRQIDTEYRRVIMSKLNWSHI